MTDKTKDTKDTKSAPSKKDEEKIAAAVDEQNMAQPARADNPPKVGKDVTFKTDVIKSEK